MRNQCGLELKGEHEKKRAFSLDFSKGQMQIKPDLRKGEKKGKGRLEMHSGNVRVAGLTFNALPEK